MVVTGGSRADRLWARATDVLLMLLLLALLAVVVWFLLRMDTRADTLEQLLAARLAGCSCPGAPGAP